jgi:hypothetical protein
MMANPENPSGFITEIVAGGIPAIEPESVLAIHEGPGQIQETINTRTVDADLETAPLKPGQQAFLVGYIHELIVCATIGLIPPARWVERV